MYLPIYEWKKVAPSEQSIKQELPKELHSTILSQYSNTKGIVLIRNGYIVYEDISITVMLQRLFMLPL